MTFIIVWDFQPFAGTVVREGSTTKERHGHSVLEIIFAEMMMVFSLKMMAWSLSIAFLGAIAGLFYGRDKQKENALRNSEEKYRILFESSKDASYITTLDGNIVEANPSHLDLFGYTKEEKIDFKATDTLIPMTG